MSILSWQTGLVEVICLDVFIHPPKGFISRCEKCDQRLPALNNNSSEFGWNWTCQHVSPSPVLWKARHFHTSLSTWEAQIIPVIQMYPQGARRGSVTATLWWWWGSVRGCNDALVWQLIYCVTFYNLVHGGATSSISSNTHLKSVIRCGNGPHVKSSHCFYLVGH